MSQYQPRHRPTPFKFPGYPPTPPETIESRSVRRMPRTAAEEHRPAVSTPDILRAQSAPDWAQAKGAVRRTSSIGYVNSGVSDGPHERPQRPHKAFIIVIPPPSFSQDDGEIASLGLGPRHRLSQGLVVPLCSTMYGQLNIIAREFSFPSTTGLCLYMTFSEDGIVMKPRILDEAWPIMWRHALEPEIAQNSRSPISGKVEFDIDIHQARWYSSWVSSLQRNSRNQTLYSSPSISHSRTESRMTFRDDENSEEVPPLPSNSRYTPRKLRLVERNETSSNVSASTHRSLLSPEKPHQTASTLSPIFQESEPQSARSALQYRVENWRASSTSKPKLLAATGQPSLEAPNIPNTLPIEDTTPASTAGGDDEIHLSDYQWSISSAGPPDYEPASPSVWDGTPSIHIMHRNQGSVCLTPTTCTSFGPDDSPWSPISSVARLPSPDIAHRMMEDCPPTPSTATSWGAPLEWPASPFAYSRPPSVHLGDRGEYSRPVTPSTATSWGPPSPLPSPAFPRERPRSVHMADRDGFSRPATPDVDIDEFEYYHSAGTVEEYRPSGFSFPYLHQSVSEESCSDQQPRAHNYPYLTIYEAVYPHFDLYPSIPGGRPDTTKITQGSLVSVKLQPTYPVFNLYPAVYPWNLDEIYPAVKPLVAANPALHEAISVKCPATYPNFDLYPAVYPWNLNEIYPAVAPLAVAKPTLCEEAISVKCPAAYPNLNLYPAVYPWNLDEIYPALHTSFKELASTNAAISVRLPAGYPLFDLYPAVYPWNLREIYPAITSEKDIEAKPVITVKLEAHYPVFNLYPEVYPWNLEAIYPPVAVSDRTHESSSHPVISTKLPAFYPNIDLYTPVYPWNLDSIYPPSQQLSVNKRDQEKSISTRLQAFYPSFNMYPPVYPWNLNEIYPSVMPASGSTSTKSTQMSIKLPVSYPNFDLYSPVYPWNLDEIYPSVSRLAQETLQERLPISTRLSPSYPSFNLYTPVYPWNLEEIYPAVLLERETSSEQCSMSPISVKLPAHYPSIDLYDPVYPWNLESIYPAVKLPASPNRRSSSLKNMPSIHQRHYPHFQLYPPVYPFFDLYPEVQPTMAPRKAAQKQLPRPLAEIAKPAPVPIKAPELRSEPPTMPSTPATWDQIFRNLTAKRQSQQATFILPSPAQNKKAISRLTHAELHAIVMIEDPSFAQRIANQPISPLISSHFSNDGYYKDLERRASLTSSVASSLRQWNDDRFPSPPDYRVLASRPESQDISHIIRFGEDDYAYDMASPTSSSFSRPTSQDFGFVVDFDNNVGVAA